jgi:tRNA pseudouridine55 synthase
MMASAEGSRRSGILLLDKPLGVSSNAALQRVRRLLGGIKAGHVGSLDPLATGMLPICLEEATKIAGDLVGRRKCYEFSIALGASTATGDAEGAVIERLPVPKLSSADVERALGGFLGLQRQVPPMYSALKHAGEPLYRLARAGREVERAAREIEISGLTLKSREDSALALEVICSKGTYVRVLAEDIARALGTCGFVTRLRRAYVEPFAHVPMHTLEELAQRHAAGEELPLLPADAGIHHLAPLYLDALGALRARQGQSVAAEGAASGRVRLYDETGRFFGVGEADGMGQVRPRRLFNLVAG